MQRELYLDPQEMKVFRIKKIISKTLIYAFLIIMGLLIIIPFYWMLITSVKKSEDIIYNISFFPSNLNGQILMPWEWEWNNFAKLFTGDVNEFGATVLRPMPFGWMFFNTIAVGALTTIGTVITVVLAAFAFARLNFKGKEIVFTIMLATMMIPGEVFVITNYMTVAKFGWLRQTSHLKTYAALVFPFITSVFYIFFLRQTFRQIPNELYLAAKVDGTSDFKYLMRVMVPMAQATITTITILSMIGTWNAYIWPSLVTNMSYSNLWLVSNGLIQGLSTTIELQGAESVLNLQMAASTMVTIPLLIVFFVFKKYIMRGVSRSGIKG